MQYSESRIVGQIGIIFNWTKTIPIIAEDIIKFKTLQP